MGLARYDRAAVDLSRALLLNPEDPSAYALRAVTYALLGRDADSQRDIAAAAALGVDPKALEDEIEAIKARLVGATPTG